MFQRLLSFGGTLLLAGAVVLTTTDPGQARGPGGTRFGGAHFGGARFYGYHRGFYPGGYLYRPYYWYRHYPYYGYRHYYPYYGFYPYSYGYPFGYGYAPYGYGYYAYLGGYYPERTSYTEASPWYPGEDRAYAPGVTAAGFTSVSPLAGGTQESGPSGQAGSVAHVTVKVPAGADVWVDGANTFSAGPVREFQSAPLTPGQQYTYEFRARWKNDDGREVTQTQQVTVTAGAHARVDFPVPSGTGAQDPVTERH